MPSGTMAQQIALRIHYVSGAGTGGSRFIRSVTRCAREAGYAHLHGLHADLLGIARAAADAEDLEAVREPARGGGARAAGSGNRRATGRRGKS